jgi:hypothetical protein
MTSLASRVSTSRDAWLATSLAITILVWFAVDSSWASALHALAKLGWSAAGFGTVNSLLLAVALVWCGIVFLVLRRTFDLPARAAWRFATGIVVTFGGVSAIAVTGDAWLAEYPVLSIVLTLLQLGLAAWIGEVSLLAPKPMPLASRILGSALLGFWGLIAFGALGLLLFPRLALRLP